jgi:hypothetical protein
MKNSILPYQVAPPGDSDDHGESSDDVVASQGHREQEHRAQEAAQVVN